MAKQQTETTLATFSADEAISLFDSSDLAAIQQEYGVTPADVTAPIPQTPSKMNFEQLCTLTSEVVDSNGNDYKNVNGHTGPLMFLEKSGEYDGEKFGGYDGFYVFTIVVPPGREDGISGKVVVTLGRPVGEKKPAVAAFLDMLTKGQLFQIGSFQTSKGFKVFNPIPVQQSKKLLTASAK